MSIADSTSSDFKATNRAAVGLILAAHGSRANHESSRLIWGAVDRLRAQGAAAEVSAAFWKQPPFFSRCLASFKSPEVWVVPCFAANGFFSDIVLPTELQACGLLQMPGHASPRVTVCPPIALHPRLPSLAKAIVQSALERWDTSAYPREDVGLVVVGHGAPRHHASRASTIELAKTLEQQLDLPESIAVFLDDEPLASTLFEITKSNSLLLLPYFIGSGDHPTVDVRRALDLPIDFQAGWYRGKFLQFVGPVLVEQSLADLAFDLAVQAGMPIPSPNTLLPAMDERRGVQNAWRHFPCVGLEHFAQRLSASGVLEIGELIVRTKSVGTTASIPLLRLLRTPSEIRDHTANDGRAHAYDAGLPNDWWIETTDPRHAAQVVETIYPGLLADLQMHEERRGVCRWPETIARQRGAFADLDVVAPEKLLPEVAKWCGSCIRWPIWFEEDLNAGRAPCLEPCAHFLSEVKHRLADI